MGVSTIHDPSACARVAVTGQLRMICAPRARAPAAAAAPPPPAAAAAAAAAATAATTRRATTAGQPQNYLRRSSAALPARSRPAAVHP